eukprot:CAMPEP_0197854762 /NCGR_PEP_ID=MMETSP1438-20131217/25284_1 /TAXON_ID=1461541 /ORGANISM="Pterosperma sp., Strain CCMP1384" /LENGTH=121 /DNA_ID=CAMNT_0043469621 /DNA_START=64 /DNA_END=429 /DNA_ORIENTATION=+
MNTITAKNPVVIRGGVTALPKQRSAKVAAKPACRAVRSAVIASAEQKQQRSEARNLAVSAPVAGAALLAAAEAHAADLVAAQPQEIADLAVAAPVFYVGFLAGATGFTVAIYLFLTKIELI